MHKTTQVSIGRKAFVCDVDAYDVLIAYLHRAEQALKHDPDVTEIVADLEASLAAHLSAHIGDLVVDKASAEAVIALMGEVPTDDTEDAHRDERANQSPPHTDNKTSFSERLSAMFKKPITKDRSRQVVDGVCAGIARELLIDPLWVRLLFVFLTIVTNGFGILVYLVLIFAMTDDVQKTSKTAGEVIDTIKGRLQDTGGIRTVESVAARVLRRVGIVVYTAVRLCLVLVLLALGLAWSMVVIYMVSDPSSVVLFGDNPSWVDFAAVFAAGATLMIPLFVLILQLTGVHSAKSARVNATAWALWVIALMLFVGTFTRVAPTVRQRLIDTAPKTDKVYVEVEDGQIVYSCVSFWGGCNLEYPETYQITVCGDKDISIIKPDADTYALVKANWEFRYETFLKPVSESAYCTYISGLLENNNGTKLLFLDEAPLGIASPDTTVKKDGAPKPMHLDDEVVEADIVIDESVWVLNYYVR